jgi:class I fructose-bisphosphate aldolase
MSSLGKQVRLNRLFSHPSGRMLGVAVDHLMNYPDGLPQGLKPIAETLRQIVEAAPSSLTVNKGIATRCMMPYAGRIPFIVQSMAMNADSDTFASHATVEEAVALGADAIAVAMFVGNELELEYAEHLGDVVREAAPYGMPVIPHIYPLARGGTFHKVRHDPEHVYYAVRVGLEMGADVIKVPFTGDAASFRDIVNMTPVPVVAAGGPKAETLQEAVEMLRAVASSGAAGATVGRNVWGFEDIGEAVRQLKEALFT